MVAWQGFDPTPYTQDAWTRHIIDIPVSKLKWCKFVTLHNTSAPTLAQWIETGPRHDARLQNLKAYYRGLGWHQGPHAFISRNFINGFSPLTEPGVHASCFNKVSIGFEMVGEYNVELFNDGDGALVRDNTVHATAVICCKLGLRPDAFKLGQSGLHFHIDCKRDNHDCPGKHVSKPELVTRILKRMDQIKGQFV